jgi:hypothetical protein
MSRGTGVAHTVGVLLKVGSLGIVLVEDVGGNIGGVVGENHFELRTNKLERREVNEVKNRMEIIYGGYSAIEDPGSCEGLARDRRINGPPEQV